MKKVEVSTWLRASLVAIIGRAQGNVRTIQQGLFALNALDFTPEEREVIGYQEQNGVIMWKNESNDRQWEIVLPEGCVPFLIQTIQGFDQWPTAKGRQVLDLLSALGWEDKEEKPK